MHSFLEVECLQGYSKTLCMGILRLSPLVVEHGAVVILQDWILWVVNFRFPFYEICVQNQRWHKLLRPSWGLWHLWSEFNYRYDGILTCFSILYCELCVENWWGRKHCFVNFCPLTVPESLVAGGWWSGAESII